MNLKAFTFILWPVLITVIISMAMSLLYLLIWEHGVSTGGDSRSYLERGYNLYQGNGLVLTIYNAEKDQVIQEFERGRLILWPLLYGFLLTLGVPLLVAPSIISLLSWFFFLLGLTWLTYCLSRSSLGALFSVATASLTFAYWTAFQSAWSEVIFLPLLVWFMAILVDLPERTDASRRHFVLASFLLALLMLTRYPGVFVCGAVLIWWGWWRVVQNKLRQNWTELVILLVAAIPFSCVILYNFLSVAEPKETFGNQLATPDPRQTFIKGVAAVGREGLQLIVPAVNHPSTREIVDRVDMTFYYLLPIYLLGLMMGLYCFWQARPSLPDLLKPPRSPLPIFLLFYLIVYTIGQPFLRMSPMDVRDSTTILALLQPWLIYWLITKSTTTRQAPVERSTTSKDLKYFSHRFLTLPLQKPYIFLVCYLILSLGLTIIPVFSQGKPDWITFYPPKLHDLSGRWDEVQQHLAAGVPNWLMVTPPRVSTTNRYHSDLLEQFQSYDDDIVMLVYLAPANLSPQALHFGVLTQYSPKTLCQSKHKVMVIIFLWDQWKIKNETQPTVIEQKCPGLQKANFDNGIIYYLEQTNSD